MKLHAATAFVDVTEGNLILKWEISNGVNRNSGDIEIVVSQENIDRSRGAILLLGGCIAQGNASFTDIDNSADRDGGGSWKSNYAVCYDIASVLAAFDKTRRFNHVHIGCPAGNDLNLLVRLPYRSWIELIMPKNIYTVIKGDKWSFLYDSELC
jgi:hypothetical protein